MFFFPDFVILGTFDFVTFVIEVLLNIMLEIQVQNMKKLL